MSDGLWVLIIVGGAAITLGFIVWCVLKLGNNLKDFDDQYFDEDCFYNQHFH